MTEYSRSSRSIVDLLPGYLNTVTLHDHRSVICFLHVLPYRTSQYQYQIYLVPPVEPVVSALHQAAHGRDDGGEQQPAGDGRAATLVLPAARQLLGANAAVAWWW